MFRATLIRLRSAACVCIGTSCNFQSSFSVHDSFSIRSRNTKKKNYFGSFLYLLILIFKKTNVSGKGKVTTLTFLNLSVISAWSPSLTH